jgi:epoxyqueuosine reductase
MPPQEATQESNHAALTLERLRAWGQAAGFSQIGVAEVDLHTAEPGLRAWLEAGFHGQMGYMARHGMARARPAELVPGTLRVVTARMDYLPMATAPGWQAVQGQRQAQPGQAVVSRYAQGRDYHKVLRQRLEGLAQRLAREAGPHQYRVFTDSAPVLEAELATRSGIGWRGKHTLVLNREAGSMFFLGEIFTDMPLPGQPCANCPLRHLHGMPGCVPNPGHRSAVPSGRAALYFLSDD